MQKPGLQFTQFIFILEENLLNSHVIMIRKPLWNCSKGAFYPGSLAANAAISRSLGRSRSSNSAISRTA